MECRLYEIYAQRVLLFSAYKPAKKTVFCKKNVQNNHNLTLFFLRAYKTRQKLFKLSKTSVVHN